MSLTFGALSSTKSMGFDENKEGGAAESGIVSATNAERYDNKGVEKLCRQESEASSCTTEDEEDDEGKGDKEFVLGPQFTLKEQLEKDKDDESLRKWKEQLLGSLDLNSVGEKLEPEVKILSISILSPGRPELVLPVPMVPNSKGLWFTLKEGSLYSLKFTFLVGNNIVSGLAYTNTVWKTGVKVDSTKEMIGTFSPQPEPYTHEIVEETTPSGFFARGTYSARTKFIDDDKKCHLEINYSFDIRKDWVSTS
ncbi:rho GDP-dissociation inhibitor 1 [Cinnamomum micranthum f. kanehirae]|uniref:Rho GDP-dissociation inhibitor 1 n=1 Tax=Cinnamomum micranthum f. kanehirae TaxID=337451 RepID=A0A3S3LUI3_9MAGN|nr:rho GDP-dissociation inhibitor 1 [Cinnamomum micranthum f. kanehirae]